MNSTLSVTIYSGVLITDLATGEQVVLPSRDEEFFKQTIAIKWVNTIWQDIKLLVPYNL